MSDRPICRQRFGTGKEAAKSAEIKDVSANARLRIAGIF